MRMPPNFRSESTRLQLMRPERVVGPGGVEKLRE